MSPTAIALLAYIAWMIMILLSLGFHRTRLVLMGKRAANSFSPTGEDVSPLNVRLVRAHANCYESFPLIGGLLLFSLVMDQTAVTDGLAYYVLGARIIQSTIHIWSTSVLAVKVRFAAFLVQIGICIYWLIELFKLQLG